MDPTPDFMDNKIALRDDADDLGTDSSESSDSVESTNGLADTMHSKKNRYYGNFRAHIDPAKAKGLRGKAKEEEKDGDEEGRMLFTNSADVHLMKVEFQVFNGIFYNLDAQDDATYKYEDPSDLYEFGEQIGQGAFSIVYKARFKPTGKIMAVKTLRPDR